MLPSNTDVASRSWSMKKPLDRLKNYLRKTLDLEVEIEPWVDYQKLPLLFRNQYDFYTCELLHARILLVLPKAKNENTPAIIKKHIDSIMAVGGRETVYICEGMPAHNRNRLIKHKVSFVVPGNQIYLPTFGMDLREHIRDLRKPPRRTFSPATQVVVLHAIYFGDGIADDVTPLELSKLLDYAKMTLTRAVDELEAASLVEVERQWKERRFKFPMRGKDLWEKARAFMRSPVKRTATVTELPEGTCSYLSGGSALSEYTMLAPPPHPTYAMTIGMWKNLYPGWRDEPKHIPEDEAVAVEIWHYPPLNAGRAGCVDPLSLLLSTGEPADERMEAALEQLENEVPWW
jgi:hypothetical protein